MLGVIESIAIDRLGPEAQFHATERALIEDPFARMLARAPVEKVERYAALLDPLLLGAGLVMYISRVRGQHRSGAQPKQSLKPTPESDPAPLPALRQNLAPIGGLG